VIQPNGNSYVPLVEVKNKYQAKRFGIPKGALTAIAVPFGVDPQKEAELFQDGVSDFEFAAYWKKNGPHDYKKDDARFDAYGNFEDGAQGTKAGFSDLKLLFAADAIKLFQNDPINMQDIAAGIAAMKEGSRLGTTIYTPPPH